MNENTNTITYKCEWCGESLSPSHKGPCPKCGKEVKGKNIIGIVNEKVSLHEKITKITIKESLKREFRREFYEKNPIIKWLVFVIDFGSPFLGLILKGWVGVIVGLVFASLSHLLAPYAVIKVREITSYSS